MASLLTHYQRIRASTNHWSKKFSHTAKSLLLLAFLARAFPISVPLRVLRCHSFIRCLSFSLVSSLSGPRSGVNFLDANFFFLSSSKTHHCTALLMVELISTALLYSCILSIVT